MPNKGLLRPGAGPELEGPGAGYQHILSTYNGNQEGTPRGLHPHSPEPISGSPGAGKWEEWAWGLGQITPSHKAPGGGGHGAAATATHHVTRGHPAVADTPTGSSSSSGSENVERRDMLDSECRERTEMAESERRGVLMGGCRTQERVARQPAGRAEPLSPGGRSLVPAGPLRVPGKPVWCPGP